MNNTLDFYQISLSYIEFLHSVDKEVFYNKTDQNYINKPYIGILITINPYKYFIPLTSGKFKHKQLKSKGKYHILITHNKSGNKETKILSLIALNKAIPVPSGVYRKIRINGHKNEIILRKELQFCKKNTNLILKQTNHIIQYQKETNLLSFACCNFALLEEACKKWTYDHLKIELDHECPDQANVKIQNGTLIGYCVLEPITSRLATILIKAIDEFDQIKTLYIKNVDLNFIFLKTHKNFDYLFKCCQMSV